MKNLLFFVFCIILSAISCSLRAQSWGEWRLPQVEIPLVQEDKTVATLKVRFISKSATISYENKEYALKLKHDLNVCEITNRLTKDVVVTMRKLGSSLIEVKPSDGKPFSIIRNGKMNESQYVIGGVTFLTVEDDKVIAGKQQPGTVELLAQATIVFRLVYQQYVSERNSNNNYYPIITTVSTSNTPAPF